MNTFYFLRKLAKTTRYQNLFTLCKELNSFKLFKNKNDLSSLQELFLQYLYMYEGLGQDLACKKVSKYIYDDILYEDAYLLWKRKKDNKVEENSKPSDVQLVISDDIKFPIREV